MKNKMELLAKEIYNWCVKNDLWGDNCIYFNGKAWASWGKWHGIEGKQINDRLYEYENKDPRKYFEYVNPETLSMSFEGSLNHILNGYLRGQSKLENEFHQLFEKYGVYAELGSSWNLTSFKLDV